MINNRVEDLNSYIKAGLLFMLIPIVVSILAPAVMELDTSSVDPLNRLQSMTSEHIMGTDDVGRDVFARTVYGIRTSLYIGVLVTFSSLLGGLIVGILSAYSKYAERILMRLVDGIMAFPTIILAIAMAGVLGAGITNIIIALSISYFPMFARISKNETSRVLNSEYVESAVALGKGDWYIIMNYVLPNIFPPLIVQTTFTFAMAILNESILSF